MSESHIETKEILVKFTKQISKHIPKGSRGINIVHELSTSGSMSEVTPGESLMKLSTGFFLQTITERFVLFMSGETDSLTNLINLRTVNKGRRGLVGSVLAY